MPNIVDILIRSTDDTKPVMDKVEREYGQSGKRSADNFTRDANGRLHDNLGKFVAEGEELGDGAGKGAGKKFSASFSPLIASVFAAAATEGPVALVAGAGVAVAGIAALVARSNANVAAEYHSLGQDVSSTLTEAVAPFAGDIESSIGILDRGLSTVGPELKEVFAAAAPYSDDIAKSILSLVDQALPGFAAGLREIQPIMQVLDTFTGDIGKGVGEFSQELGKGSSGAAVGLQALGNSLEHVLNDVGEVAGALSNGLGPAVRDVLTVATPVVDVLAKFVSAIPPQEIQVAAVAVAALYAAFKIGTITKVVAEGTTFLQFLRGTVVAEEAATVATVELGVAEEEVAVQTGLLAKAQAGAAVATGAMSTAAAAATGPWGALAAALFMATDYIDKHTKVELNLFDVISTLNKAYNTHATSVGTAANEIGNLTLAMTSAAGKASALTQALVDQKDQASANAQTTAQTTLAALGATDGQSQLTQSLYGILTAYSAASTGAGAYSSAIQALNGTTMGLDDAQNNLAQQMLNAKTSFAQNSYSLDLNTQAGINNKEALSQAAKSIIAMGVAQYQSSGNIDQANQTIQSQIQAYVKATGATGQAKNAIESYLESISKIPPNVATTVYANTGPARSQLGALIDTIDSSTGYVSIQAHTSRPQAYAHGGAVGSSHAAEGGPRGNVVTVGEHGIEDVELPVGSTVLSHEDTMSRRGSGGSGEQHLILEWVGSSSDPIFQLLRSGIRARFGSDPNSVQKMLGFGS